MDHGLSRGLTNYGDRDFALYLRRSFARSMGYSTASLAKPVVGIADSGSGFNNCHRHFPELIDAVRMLGGGVRYFRWWGRYVLLWETDRAWAGTCRAFILKLDDGSTHTFVVRFDKACRGGVWVWPPPSKIASKVRTWTTS